MGRIEEVEIRLRDWVAGCLDQVHRRFKDVEKNVSELTKQIKAYDKKPELAIEMEQKGSWEFGDLITDSDGKEAVFLRYNVVNPDLFFVLALDDTENMIIPRPNWLVRECKKIGSGYQYVSLEGILKRLQEGR